MTGIATDGTNVYVSCVGGEGIFKTVQGTSSGTQYITTGSFNSVGYANDRLMAAQGPSLYNITHAQASTTLTGATLMAGSNQTVLNCAALPQNIASGDSINLGSGANQEVVIAADAAAQGDIIIFIDAINLTYTHAAGDLISDQKWSDPDTALFTHNNQDWIWDCYAGGSSQLYVGGHSSLGGYTESVNGGASGIYRNYFGLRRHHPDRSGGGPSLGGG